VVLLGLIAIQFVPVKRDNPPVQVEIPAPPAVQAVLRESCYDCHSNETVWPWYSRVAPISWLVADDVRKGREEVNFSTWNVYPAKVAAHKIEEMWDEVEEGKMPLPNYLRLHPEARLTEEDRKLLGDWVHGK
jgi:uncharacterized membrane protein